MKNMDDNERKKFCAFDRNRICDSTCVAYYKLLGKPHCERIKNGEKE